MLHEDEAIERINTRPVVLIESQATLRHAAQMLANESIGVAIVRGYFPPALISERDIIGALAEGARPDIDRVDSVMNLDVACASPHDSIGTVGLMMLNNEIRHIPIVQDGAVVRVVSEREVLRALLDEEDPDTE
jgi:signal-transduction protein with cAMP-binding, CBS, and nucleotidyltransferase domain